MSDFRGDLTMKLCRYTAAMLVLITAVSGCAGKGAADQTAAEIVTEQMSQTAAETVTEQMRQTAADTAAEQAELTEADYEAKETRSDETVELQFLATSDLHGKFLPYDYLVNTESYSGSCAQIATAVAGLRTENTILIDGGDTIQGNGAELFLQDELNPMMLYMNSIDYDVWVTGNHEYNYGMDTLLRIILQNKAPLLCGNVYDSDMKPLGEDYTIVERGGVKVGIIGMVTPNIRLWDQKNLLGWTVTDPVEETKQAINELKDKVDVLIAVDHMDVNNECDEPDSGVEDLANACPELDLIIAAHGHKKISNLTINGVPVIENKNGAKTLGRVLMDLRKTEDGWEVTDTETMIYDMKDYVPDEALSEALDPYHQRALEEADKVIGRLDADYLAAPDEIDGLPTSEIKDTAVGDLILETMRYYADADVAGSQMPSLHTNLSRGDIRKCDVAQIYIYENTLYKVEMTGAQLKRWMEAASRIFVTVGENDLTTAFKKEEYLLNHELFSGVNYDIDISEEPGNRIKNLTWPDGTPVKDDDVFTAAVNNYRYGSSFAQYGNMFDESVGLPKLLEMDVRGDIGGVRELIRDYIANVKGGVLDDSCDHNWKLTGTDWDPELHKRAAELIKEGKLTTAYENGKNLVLYEPVRIEDLEKAEDPEKAGKG